MNSFITFLIERKGQIGLLILQHIELTLAAVFISIIIGVPLGILITRVKKLGTPIIGMANIIQAIPSLALLGFLIPILGIGSKPAILMVFLYSLLPIIKNTYIGLININDDIIEAAKGMGMTQGKILTMVQIPLALPVIMAGIRISAVTAVGLMTIAAFIGAGGLGTLVYTGVQTVNNNMILAGAIPACILALVMDYVIGKIEKVVANNGKGKSKKDIFPKNKIFTYGLILLCGIFIFVGIFSVKRGKDTIVIGAKSYNEQLILSNIMAIMLEKDTDLKIEKKLNLSGSVVAFNAIKAGEIDILPEYTGTGFVNIMGQKPISDKDKVYNMVQEYYNKNYNIKWLKPFGFNNTYALAVREETARKYNLITVSDLAKVSNNLILGCTMEFSTREDGCKGLEKQYNMKFKDIKTIDGGLRYTAIDTEKTEVTDAFSTEGLIKAFNLKLLEDDKKMFPPYYAVPIVRQETLKKHPEVEKVLNKLENEISEDEMRELNYKVDKEQLDPEVVAEQFLKSKGLIK